MKQISLNSKLELIKFRNSIGFPPTICIQLLNWCNLTCRYCRSNSSPFLKNKLDYQSLKPILVNLINYDKWRISLTGGEPFHWKDINQLLVLLYSLDYIFSITTNGFNSKQIFDSIDSYVWDKCTLYVSIDGDKITHNQLRGENSYENAISFLEYVRPRVRKLYVSTVLYTDPNIWAKKLYDELNKFGVNNWSIITPVKQGRWFGDINNLDSFSVQYNHIQSIAKGKTTTSYLDFAKTDKILSDIVFIDSDGTVRMPGYFDHSLKGRKPLSFKVNLQDADLIPQIINSVNNFITLEKYML